MKKPFRCIIALFMCVVMLFSLNSLVYAAETETLSYSDAVPLWDFIRGSECVGVLSFIDSLFSHDDDGCTVSPSGFHSWHCVDSTVGLITNSILRLPGVGH